MSNYFVSPEDLGLWVKSKPDANSAAQQLIDIVSQDGQKVEESDIVQTCRSIYDNSDQNASSILFGVLAKHNLTSMQKQAQSQSRQRNGWVRGMRNKWNRVVDGFNEGTPWRVDRDKMYNFTHYYTDAITFDEDPNRVYSGEAIWRSYIMDKYSREYQDKDGHWVGGYINNRFHVFPDAGTPANPGVPRDGGNLLGLKPGERTRKPRPHQYSTERRLEEARGTETTDLEVTAASIQPIAKIASNNLPKERHDDNIYNILKDTIEMREAGFEYTDMIQKIASHYNASITGVAQIDAFAQKLIQKHSGVFYQIEKSAQMQQSNPVRPNATFSVQTQLPVISNGRAAIIQPGTTVIALANNTFEAINDATGIKQFTLAQGASMDSLQSMDEHAGGHIQEASDEVGLNEVVDKTQPVQSVPLAGSQEQNFPVTET